MTDYFISDAHLYPEGKQHPGTLPLQSFLKGLSNEEPGRLWILGDLFDYWFEYRGLIPSGYSGTLCTIRGLISAGWKVAFIPGNHDWWCGKGLQEATGMSIMKESVVQVDIQGLKCLLSHGDGLGKGDTGYRLMKPVLRSRVSETLFSTVHPVLATGFARMFSGTSRRILRKQVDTVPEYLSAWVREQGLNGFDLAVTGHTHCPAVRKLGDIIHVSLGDWISHFTYLVIRGGEISLDEFRG